MRTAAALALCLVACLTTSRSALAQIGAGSDSTGAHRLALVPRNLLALPAADLQALADGAARAGATDLLVDYWWRGTVPYVGSEVAPADSAVAAGDPIAVLARRASDLGLRTWLWMSGGFEVWQTPLTAPVDPGPFLHEHPGVAATARDGTPGFADTTAGVRRYALQTGLLEAHRMLTLLTLEALARYPVAGVVVTGVESQSDDIAFNPTLVSTYFTIMREDPRSLTPADSAGWEGWQEWRKEQLNVFTTSLARRIERENGHAAVAAFVRPSGTRGRYLQEWPGWVARHAVSWLVAQTTARSADALAKELAGTAEETRGVPWGIALDASTPPSALAEQVALVRKMGGRVFAVDAKALGAEPERWKALWTGAAAPAPPTAPKKRVPAKTTKATARP